MGRVFISYSHLPVEHQAQVLLLRDLLHAGGIETVLDQDVDIAGQQWLDWMEEQVRSAEFVLVVASSTYGRQADPGTPVDDITGRGTWYEARLLRDEVYRDEGHESLKRILPVVLPGGSPDDLPAFFAARTQNFFQVRSLTHEGVADLVRVLRREPGVRERSFLPLRHEVVLDVTTEAAAVTTRLALSGRILGERRHPVPHWLARVWSMLDSGTAATELAEAGRTLAEALFEPEWLGEVTRLADSGTPVEIIVTTDGEGLALPYELLRTPDGRVLATIPGVRLSRRVRGVERPHQRPGGGPLKILAAVAAPTNSTGSPLDIEAEMQAIIDVVGGLQAQVKILEVASPAQITSALRHDPYHVLHLSAHGSATTIELEDEDGLRVEVRAQSLVDALNGADRQLPLLVLSSCSGAARGDTGLAATLVRAGLHRVIAMQTAVTDRYATRLLGAVYAELAEHNPAVGVALARARADLFRQAQEGQAQQAAQQGQSQQGRPPRPEYGIATMLTGGADAPLVDLSADAQPLAKPTEPPAGGGVRELPLGELIGRRAQLWRTLRLLRDDPATVAEVGATCGVTLTGVGGIGKTALAGRVMSRLREDGWRVAVHEGRFSPYGLFAALAKSLVDGHPARSVLTDPEVDDAIKLGEVVRLLHAERLLLVFDDFEQNLTPGGGAFHDEGFGALFVAFCGAASRGKLLVTCRYPVPGADDLAQVAVPPLSPAELNRLLLRLPALADLEGEDRRTVIETIGGHPRLIEFVDALMRGRAGRSGRAKMTHVASKLRELAKEAKVRLATKPETAPNAAEAVRQAVRLGSVNIFLTELLDLLSDSQRELLLQAAVSRMPLRVVDLAVALPEVESLQSDVDRLVDLTLLTEVDDGVLVITWIADALDSHQGEERVIRHRRAGEIHEHRIRSEDGTFEDLTELARHLGAQSRFDDLGAFALEASRVIGGEQGVATFLGSLLPTFPRDHPALLSLIDRERAALINTGNIGTASERAREMLAVATTMAERDPDDVDSLRWLGIIYERLGNIAVSAGDLVTARFHYEQSLAIDRRLVDTDPTNTDWLRDLGVSNNKLGDVARSAGDLAASRTHYEEALAIAQRLAAADPSNTEWQRDLAISYNKLGDLATLTGDLATARTNYEMALAIGEELTASDSSNTQWQRDLGISHNKLGDVAVVAGDLAGARAHYEQTLAIRRRLVDSDPTNTQWQRDLSISHSKLGDVAMEAKDLAAARVHYEESLSIALRLAEADPTNSEWQRDLSVAYNRLGELARAAGDLATARTHYEHDLAIAVRLAAADPTNTEWQRDLSVSYIRLGDVARASGDLASARAHYELARTTAERLARTDPGNATWRDDLAVVQRRLADIDRPRTEAATEVPTPPQRTPAEPGERDDRINRLFRKS